MNKLQSLLVGRRFATMRFSQTRHTAPYFRRRLLNMESQPTTCHRMGSRTFSMFQQSSFFGKNWQPNFPANRYNNCRSLSSKPTEGDGPGPMEVDGSTPVEEMSSTPTEVDDSTTVEGVSSTPTEVDGSTPVELEDSMLWKFTHALGQDGRKQLSRKEFVSLSLGFGFEMNILPKLKTTLLEKGVIMDFGNEFDTIVIQPEEVNKAWNQALDLDGSHAMDFMSKRKVQLDALRLEIEPLEVELRWIEEKSERSAVWWMRGLFGYTIVHTWMIAYLTFWVLSWDIMEPITYLVNLYTFVIAVYFFNSTSTDFTFDAMKDTLKAIKRRKLFLKKKFDEEEYDRLKREIYLAEQDLYNPEWFALNEVTQEATGTVMPNPTTAADKN